jgi:crotonobetainyl-CoA:carnitine CoA-transferase CaiB-like acyl-CoA transferase
MPTRKNAWGVYDVFTAKDGGQVFIGCTSDGHWQRFCEAFGLEEWRDDERFGSNSKRCEERERFIPELRRRLLQMPMEQILEKCEVARIAYARVGRPDELTHDIHLNAHGGLLATTVSALGGGTIGIPALPIEFSDGRERPNLSRQPPQIGEHTREIMLDAGYEQALIDRLCADGLLRCV